MAKLVEGIQKLNFVGLFVFFILLLMKVGERVFDCSRWIVNSTIGWELPNTKAQG